MFHLPLLLVVTIPLASPQSASQNLDGTVRRYVARGFSGSIVVQEEGKKIFESSFGLANRAFEVPFRADTKFLICSITKAFTSVVVLKLVEEGRIDLHKTIHRYLPSYSGPAATRVTVEELLNHTSGIRGMFSNVKSDRDAMKHGIIQVQMPFTVDELIAKFCSGPLVHKPGKVFDYNDGDYMILGKIVEKVTGKSFDRVLRERILAPLKMSDTGMLHQKDIVKNLATSYFSPDMKLPLINDMPIYPENWYASGAMYSTTGDLLKFAEALYSGSLLKPHSLERMLKPGLGGYGYGVWVGYPKFGGRRYRNVNRPGGIMGANGSFYHFNGVGFSKSINIVILSNNNLADMDSFSWDIGKALLDH